MAARFSCDRLAAPGVLADEEARPLYLEPGEQTVTAKRLFLVAAALSAAAALIIIVKDMDRLPIALIFMFSAILFGALSLRGSGSETP